MDRKRQLKLVLIKDNSEVKSIVDQNSNEGMDRLLKQAEAWKQIDPQTHTVKLIAQQNPPASE